MNARIEMLRKAIPLRDKDDVIGVGNASPFYSVNRQVASVDFSLLCKAIEILKVFNPKHVYITVENDKPVCIGVEECRGVVIAPCSRKMDDE